MKWPLPPKIADFSVISLVCIRGSITETVSEIHDLLQSGRDADCWIFSNVPFDLRSVYQGAPPLGGAHFDRYLLWEPASSLRSTALISNYVDGMQMTIRGINRKFDRECVRVLLSRDYEYLPECRFEFFGQGGQHRLIEVFKDDAWEFRSEGEIREFENLSYYVRSLKRDRLNASIAAAYLCETGWNIMEESFWDATSQAVLVRRIKSGVSSIADAIA
jgi:hypothetical protein